MKIQLDAGHFSLKPTLQHQQGKKSDKVMILYQAQCNTLWKAFSSASQHQLKWTSNGDGKREDFKNPLGQQRYFTPPPLKVST